MTSTQISWSRGNKNRQSTRAGDSKLDWSPYLKAFFTACLSLGCCEPSRTAFFRDRLAATKSPSESCTCGQTWRGHKHTRITNCTNPRGGRRVWTRSYLADAVKALALTELVLYLPGTLFGLFQAAHRVRVLTVTKVDVAQIKVCTVEILQQLALPSHDKNEGRPINKRTFLPEFVH